MIASIIILLLSLGIVSGSILGLSKRKELDLRSIVLICVLGIGSLSFSGAVMNIANTRTCRNKVAEIYKLVDTGLIDCKNRLTKCESLTMGDILKV